MDPLKAFAATLFCLALFVLVFRLTRRLMELAIAAGHAEAERLAAAEAASPSPAALARPEPQTGGHATGAVP